MMQVSLDPRRQGADNDCEAEPEPRERDGFSISSLPETMTSWQPLKALAGAGSVVMLEHMNDRHEQNGQAVADHPISTGL